MTAEMSVLGHSEALGVRPGRLYVGGAWSDASDGAVADQVNPATNEVVTTFAVGSAADVDRAVRSARRAFDEGPWPRLHAGDRKAILQRLVGLIERNGAQLDALQCLENGMPISFSSLPVLSASMAAGIFDHHAGWIDKLCGETYPSYGPSPTGNDVQMMSVREPVGVVAAITPWNAPLMLFAQKAAPALSAGCTIVMKPSELAVLTALRLTELIEEAGIPPGVFNLVPGPGDPTGEALINHPMVDKVTFTGSRAVGRHILSVAGEAASAPEGIWGGGLKRVTLELGGKSPSLIFSDATSVETAGQIAMGMVALGISGQGCVCQTRALVERSVYDTFIEAALSLAGSVVQGDPFDPATTAGPIISARQLAKVVGYIEGADAAGARRLCGGERPGGALAQGNFVTPALFADVDNAMTVAREEVFGPVLVAIPFDDESDAVRIANDSDYGLGAGVYTASIGRGFRVARALRAGTVGINDYTVMPNAPFGGYKTSGLGREGGWAGIEAFTELKTIVVGLGD